MGLLARTPPAPTYVVVPPEPVREMPWAARAFLRMLGAIRRGTWMAAESLIVLAAKGAWEGALRWPRAAATLYGVVWAVAAPPLWVAGWGWGNLALWLVSPALPAGVAHWWHTQMTGADAQATSDPAAIWSAVLAGDQKTCTECRVAVGGTGLPVWVEGRGQVWCQPHAPRWMRGLTTVTDGPS